MKPLRRLWCRLVGHDTITLAMPVRGGPDEVVLRHCIRCDTDLYQHPELNR